MTACQKDTGSDVPIIQYWHSKEIPADIAGMLLTFRNRHLAWRHMVFDELEADSFIAERLTARELSAFRRCAVPAMQADYFRYCAALLLGGICCDVDYNCVQRFDELMADADQGLLFRKDNGAVDNGFFLFKSPGHPLLRLALEVATTNIEQRAKDEVWWTTGPSIFTILWEVCQRGSFDAVRQEASERGVGTEVEQILTGIGNYECVPRAFAGVRVMAFDTALEWIEPPETPPLYKQSELHWINWQAHGRTIFR